MDLAQLKDVLQGEASAVEDLLAGMQDGVAAGCTLLKELFHHSCCRCAHSTHIFMSCVVLQDELEAYQDVSWRQLLGVVKRVVDAAKVSSPHACGQQSAGAAYRLGWQLLAAPATPPSSHLHHHRRSRQPPTHTSTAILLLLARILGCARLTRVPALLPPTNLPSRPGCCRHTRTVCA